MISNPVNLAPVLSAQTNALVDEINENQTDISAALAALLAEHGASQVDIAAALASINANVNDKTAAISEQIVSPVKSIQRGVSSVGVGATVNVTLSPVTMSKSVVLMSVRNESNSSNAAMCTAALTGSTNLALVSGTSQNSVVVWQVVEYV